MSLSGKATTFTTTTILLLFVSLLFIISSGNNGNGVNALLPKECAHNITQPMAVCCPHHPHNGMQCGGHFRGKCQRIVAPKEQVPLIFHMDDRAAWPTRFFSYACQCHGNYFGPSCEECWFGWEGKNCDKKVMRVRKDIRKLSRKEREIFVDVVAKSRTWPSGYYILDESDNWNSDPLFKPKFLDASVQYFISFNHRYGSRTTLFKNLDDCNTYGILDFNHDGVTFPTWHRYFLLVWERMLAKIAHKVYGVTDFTVPYWDSIGLKSCDICNNDFIGGPGYRDNNGLRIDENHKFHNMSDFCYEPVDGIPCYGCQKSGKIGKLARDWNSYNFPDQDDYRYVLDRRHYYIPGERNSGRCESFHMALEGFCGRPGTDGSMLWTHNRIHNMIDGSMCCAATASNDPIFILHHTFVDKVYSMWYEKYKPKLNEYPNHGQRPGHCRDCFMVGFMPPVRNGDMFVSSTEFGYDYDNKVLGQYAHNRKGVIHI